MAAPLLIDLSHTSHTRVRTGIQRVARSLHAAAGESAIAVTYDPYLVGWRPLQDWEIANLTTVNPGGKRGAHWPIRARLQGRVQRLLPRADAPTIPCQVAGVIVPELFSPTVAGALRLLAPAAPRVALFHDAIPLQLPELSPPKTVARFPGYLLELLQFDGIAAVSDASRDALLEYWRWAGLSKVPPVRTIPLGIEAPPAMPGAPVGTAFWPTVLAIGSIEGRKNHVALLEACEQLWAAGDKFELRLIGLAQRETGARALDRIRHLQSAGRPLRYDGMVDDAALEAAYAACTFTVYPSLLEGFGLPVLESVARGKPCVCLGRGALGEAARPGGCVALDRVDSMTLASAMRKLLTNPPEVARLADEARRRTFRTWRSYAAEIADWIKSLGPHDGAELSFGFKD